MGIANQFASLGDQPNLANLPNAVVVETSAIEDFLREHATTTVLSSETGFDRPYGRSPYGDYARSERLLFPVAVDRRYHPKMPTLGLRVPGHGSRAYPASELARAGAPVEERFLGHRVRIAYDADRQVFDVEAPPEVEVIEGFWFAWAAFHPETSVFSASGSLPQRSR